MRRDRPCRTARCGHACRAPQRWVQAEIRAAVLSDSLLTRSFRFKVDHKILASVCLKERSLGIYM